MRGPAGEEGAAVRGVAGERGRGEGERAVRESEHLLVVGAARGVLLEPPLESEGLQVGQHGVVGAFLREGGEVRFGPGEVPVVDEAEGRAGLGVSGPRQRRGRPEKASRRRERDDDEDEARRSDRDPAHEER